MNIKSIFDKIKTKLKKPDGQAVEAVSEEITETAVEATADIAEAVGDSAPEAVDAVEAAETAEAVSLSEDASANEVSFADSINALTADDIAPKVKKKPSTSGIVRIAVMAVCGAVFLYSASTLVSRLAAYKRANDIYGDISDNIFDSDLRGAHAVAAANRLSASPRLDDYYTALSSDTPDYVENISGERNERFERVKANLTYLKSINPDIFGYIYIEGTNINFPIVQGEDNEYYLNRAWNGEYLVVGSIYADYRADTNMDNNRNTVFFGHNMMDGNMFNNVMLFFDEEIFNSKVVEIYTFDGIYTYEPFSIFRTLNNYPYFRMSFSSDEDFVAFCEQMQSDSDYNKGMTFTGDDHIITFSTCTPSDDAAYYYRGRITMHSKLIKVERP